MINYKYTIKQFHSTFLMRQSI